MQALRKYLWSHVVDLVFDCFYVSNLVTDQQKSRILSGLKDSADFLGQIARISLKSSVDTSDPEPRLLQIRHFLNEVKRQLELANGLGVMSNSVYQKLSRRTEALLRAFHHPRVDALFANQVTGA